MSTGYIYPTAIGIDYQTLANLFAARMAGVTGSPAPPPVPTSSDGFLLAMCDVLNSGLAYRDETDGQAGASTIVGGSAFADFTAAYPAWTPRSILMQKTYELTVSLGFFVTGSAKGVNFEVQVDGSVPSQPTAAARLFCNSTSFHYRLEWKIPLLLAAGSHTFKVFAKADSGTTLTTNSDDYYQYSLR